MLKQEELEYPDLQYLMRACGLTQSPAEAQGAAAALCSVDRKLADAAWASEFYTDLAADDANAVRCRRLLERLRGQVVADLEERELGLALFLPEDEPGARAAAVRDWCGGFLFGLGSGGPRILARLSDEGREAVHDFTEINRLDTTDVPADDAGGAALMEIEEYVRMAAIVVVEDLRQERNDQAG